MLFKPKSIYNFYIKLKIRLIKLLGLNELNLIYTRRFYKKSVQEGQQSATVFSRLAYRRFKPKSVIDLGCGSGIYLKYFFTEPGVKIIGIDGSKKTKDVFILPQNYLKIFDLRSPLNLKTRYDLAICIEVAEHIDESKSQMLVDNLCRCSNIVLFTAAPRGQGGTHHINEQPKKYWIKKFSQCGYKYDLDETKLIAKELEDQKVTWWLYKNLMIFKKDEPL